MRKCILVVILSITCCLEAFRTPSVRLKKISILRSTTDEITNEKASPAAAVRSVPPITAPGGTSPNVRYEGGKKEYKPRNSDGTLKEFPKKDYNSPKAYSKPGQGVSQYNRPPGNYSSGGGSGGGGSYIKQLDNPQLLIRYRLPRVKTAFKKELEELQETLRKQSDASRPPRFEGGGFRGGGQSDNKADYYDKFLPPAACSDGDGKKFSSPSKKKEADRKGSEGGRPKDGEDRARARKAGGGEDLDDDIDDADEGGEDYFGDGEVVGLSAVPFSELKNMENEGYNLEEMQMTLYGEYGIKVSVAAIRRRLTDESREKKKKGKTGKTRRDKQKARSNARNPFVQRAIELPESGPIQVSALAGMMEVGAGEVVKHLMLNMGIMASMNQNIDTSVARKVCEAFGKRVAGDGSEDDEDDEDEDEDAVEEMTSDGDMVERVARSPIVTIMGHVDHGKTSLLDRIRSANVAKGEAGGITQGISAFKVQTGEDKYVTFLDTPGHAAFSEMRKRGANVTDIVVLVVAADDGVMEQTKECIVAAKRANCPIVVAVNKIDKEGADFKRIATDLMSYDILIEEFGGEVQCVQVSAKQGVGIEELLEKIQLQAEVMNLKAPVVSKAEGTVIESRVDRGLGTVVTALVQKGTLKVGDFVLAGPSWGKVRRIISDQGKDIREAGPATPVQIVGMGVVPNAGDTFSVTADEAGARDVAEARQRLNRQAVGTAAGAALIAQASGFAEGTFDNREIIKVPVMLKADVSGSVEAIRMALGALEISDSEAICRADIVYSGVGEVTSSDVSIAAAAKAKVIAFNVAAGMTAMDEARANNVNIGYYNVVYDLLDELEATIKKTLAPPPPGNLVGRAEIKKIFRIGKVGKIGGCQVTEGFLRFDSQIRIMRGKRNAVYLGKFSSLKIVKDPVTEVSVDTECGVSFDDFQDFEEGDVIECFTTAEL